MEIQVNEISVLFGEIKVDFDMQKELYQAQEPSTDGLVLVLG